MMKKVNVAACLLTLFLLAGCAAPQAKLRYVWPPLPDEPKIEYLGVYNSDKDFEMEGYVTKFLGRDASPLALHNPQMVAGDGHGRVYVTDIKLAAVLIFDFNANKVDLLGGEGGAGLFGQPTGIALDGDGSIYVADSAKRKIMIFTRDGRPSGSLDLSAQLKSIGFIAIDKQRKRIVVPDPKGNKVHIVDAGGKITATLINSDSPDNEFNRPNAAAVAPNGDIVVADSMNARVVLFGSDGKFLSAFGTRGDNPGQFNLIQGIAVDSGGHIYVTDARSNNFTIMSAKGEALLAVGSQGDSFSQIGSFEIPFGISIDQNDTIYIVEKYHARFQKYQFLSAGYLAKNPIRTETLAKPVAEEKKDSKTAKPAAEEKKDSKGAPPAPK